MRWPLASYVATIKVQINWARQFGCVLWLLSLRLNDCDWYCVFDIVWTLWWNWLKIVLKFNSIGQYQLSEWNCNQYDSRPLLVLSHQTRMWFHCVAVKLMVLVLRNWDLVWCTVRLWTLWMARWEGEAGGACGVVKIRNYSFEIVSFGNDIWN